MWLAVGVGVDLIHALAMTAWLVGFPLLFVRRWPRARLAYAIYAVTFIVASQASMFFMGECFLTAVTRWCLAHDPAHVVSDDWFTVRIARAVFGMAPSRHVISRISEALVLVTAIGIIVSSIRSASLDRGGDRVAGRRRHHPWLSSIPRARSSRREGLCDRRGRGDRDVGCRHAYTLEVGNASRLSEGRRGEVAPNGAGAMNEVHVESKPLRSSWLWLVSGVALIALTHFRWGVGALAWVAPVPLLVYLRSTSGFRSRALFSVAVIVGWTLATLKIISAPMPAALAMAFGVPIALFQLVPYFSWDFLRRRCRPWVAALAFASVGVLVEWAEWRLTPLGSWGAAAYTQVEDLPLLQVASLFGMAGVSFLVYWCAAAVEAAIAERGTAPSLRGLAVAIGVVAAAHAFGAIRLGEGVAGDTVRVAAVGTDSTAGGLPLPDADTRHRWDDALFARTVQAAKAGARVVVWTEAATVALVEDEAQLVGRGRDVARAEGIELVLAYVVPVQVAPLRYENKYQWLRPDGTIDHVYLKHEPVPGEPSVRGTGAQGLVATAAGNASGAICYDFDFPYLALAQARLGVDFVAVPSSDWAGIDPIHAQMAAVRAIEGGFSLVRSTRFGLSVVVDPLGRTRGWLSNNDSRERVLVASVPVHRVATLYTRIGDLLPATCGAFIASLLVSLGLRRRGRTQGGVAPSHAVARELA